MIKTWRNADSRFWQRCPRSLTCRSTCRSWRASCGTRCRGTPCGRTCRSRAPRRRSARAPGAPGRGRTPLHWSAEEAAGGGGRGRGAGQGGEEETCGAGTGGNPALLLLSSAGAEATGGNSSSAPARPRPPSPPPPPPPLPPPPRPMLAKHPFQLRSCCDKKKKAERTPHPTLFFYMFSLLFRSGDTHKQKQSSPLGF